MKSELRFRLRDRNQAVVDAWRQHFADCPDVTVSAGDIFAEPADAVEVGEGHPGVDATAGGGMCHRAR